MYAAGVTCTDCHNPHTQKLRATGNQICTQCHAPERFDVPEHHFHPESSAGAECVSCHMPATTYMRVDDRRDHSFRVPRPDRTVALGVPNACSNCHADRSAQWAAAAVEQWYGTPASGFQTFAGAFSAFERGAVNGDSSLALIAVDNRQPAWVRASALARLAVRPSPAVARAALAEIQDPDPLVRHSALRIGDALPPTERIALAETLLDDSVRVVRMQAAWVLAPAAGLLTPAQRPRFQQAADEFIDLHRRMADRPESRVTLGTFFVLLERYDEAEAEFRSAIRLSPRETPAYVNLADLFRLLSREDDARQVLQEGLALSPDDPTLHYSLGLALVRAGEHESAILELRLAAELDPEQPRFAYAYAVALNSAGFRPEAIASLRAAVEAHPRERDLFVALVSFLRDAGDLALARAYADRLVELDPEDAGTEALLRSLQGSSR